MIAVALEGRKSRKAQQRQPDEQPAALRVRIIERDDSTCYMCRRKLPFDEVTLEHLVPRSRGGKTAARRRQDG